MRQLLAALMAAPALFAAAPGSAQTSPVINLTEYDDGTTARADVGTEIRVRLPQSAGTAYSWAMRRDPHLSLIAPPTTVQQRGNTGIVGMRQMREFRIRVLSPGRFPLTFGLRSAALGPDQVPAKRISYTVDAAVEHGAERTTAALSVDDEGLRLVNPQNGASRPIPFGTARQLTLNALAGQGRATTGSQAECDSGPVTTAEYPSGLTLYFQENRFRGWALDRRGAGRVTTMAGIAPGSTRAQLNRAYTARVQRTSLGYEFLAGDLYGVLDGPSATARITSMWAGTTCIAR